ncbi:MAG TPA: 3-deoxy-7-phosphoheptulonate synthase AroG [Accumulibacter sp.]|uniref:3-deoxy-7-phosphoheptulonate synthase AroG n=1 Tax=Accumulibacter sp. TaxID=2053492 RepID=UPI002B589B3A|nr:3-deoxy-7-phosphoheptulonate synthase AroG [Accumulibacter sp.]HMW56733.1 3-deoxy-7-phosphoheptulonate synthase AroG [Accumulibacter sp.]
MTMQSKPNTDDVRIREIKELVPPAHIFREFPVGVHSATTTYEARQGIHRILHGADNRLLVVLGPCSIHDVDSAVEYAHRLEKEASRFANDLLIVMRVYFEKPRTTVGWKGLINDPRLDNSFRINEGLRLARGLLLEINDLGLPCATEFLDTITPQYTADLIAWGAIGARTTESQVHRELASGLSCPVGFKNGTDGNIRIAIDAIRAAQSPHHFLSVTKAGRSAIVSTCGNEDCHVILRGGKEPNYDAAHVDAACREIAAANLAARLMIDASHANSNKQFKQQIEVAKETARQIAAGDQRIVGVMLESHLVEGRQDLVPGQPLEYGKSITDACLGWEDSLRVLEILAQGVRARRLVEAAH